MSDYETDIAAWSEHQAALLRRAQGGEWVNDQIDWPNIIEEIESLSRSEQSRLANRVRTIFEHLAKLEASPAADPRPGWIETVARSRADVQALLEASPSLRPKLPAIIADALPAALRLADISLKAHGETPRVPLQGLAFAEDDVLGDWIPQWEP
ncbi:MAG TPA: DUF29 domain-containing protein [Rhodopila sp.]|jgi:hypothetical protein|nr:DUF29 domain-containing protein [Rhodopila sp.]